MKKIYVICCFITLLFIGRTDCLGAVRGGGRTISKTAATNTNTTQTARAATIRQTTANNNPAGGRTLAARAATKKSVTSAGTKITTAQANIAVNAECQQKFDGCMDSFCMLDNVPGGRCICSDDIKKYNATLEQIEALNKKSYDMATIGMNKIEMGHKATQVINAAKDAVSDIIQDKEKQSRRNALQLNSWFSLADSVDEDLETAPPKKSIGDKLLQEAIELCRSQIPECATNIDLLARIYERKILSDCNAYGNSLKQQQTEAEQKLRTVELSLQDAALNQLNAENKYDLGQCMQEFKKCMINTGNCGENFANCASVVAIDNTNVTQKSKTQTHSIQGKVSNIYISASTYETLVGKAPLCTSVLNQCVAVKDQVFDAFLRDVAPQLKNAELIAESNIRQNCILSVSKCFQKACKDNIDPNNPDGSYDMCLSRPATMLNVCKVELNQCGIDASSPENAENSEIWNFVLARLASMRVDSCTKEVKECLTAEDRCGEDYTQCVGLDTDTIIRMCPYDKLTACVEKYGAEQVTSNEVYDNLADTVQGIMMNIDNNMLTQCQNAANEAMIKVCGDTENCNGLAVDDNIGARSLEYKICEYISSGDTMDISYSGCRTDISQIMDSELGRIEGSTSGELGPVTPFAGVLDGTIYWGSVDFDENGRLVAVEEYLNRANQSNATDTQKERVRAELAALQKNINTAIDAIEADPIVQFCMIGREVQGMRRSVETKGHGKNQKKLSARSKIGEKSEEAARFPELTKQMRLIIATRALKVAKDNYYKKYDELNEKMLQDYAKMGERMAEIKGENALDSRREIARVACISFAEASALPKTPNPPKGMFGKILAAAAVVGAAVAIPFTGGLSIATVAVEGVTATAVSTGAVVAGAALATAGIGLVADATAKGGGNGADGGIKRELIGSKQLNQWNYKETITSTFEWETLVCHKCIRSQNCTNKRRPWFGKPWCKSWADPVEKCTDTEF